MIIETKTVSDMTAFIATEHITIILFVRTNEWRIGLCNGELQHIRNNDVGLLAKMMLCATWMTSLSEQGKAELMADLEGEATK